MGSTAIASVPVAADWAGAHVGAHVGYGFDDVDFFFVKTGDPVLPLPENGHEIDGIIGGLQAGYTFQSGNIVFGVEADYSWSDIDGEVVDVNATSIDWMATIRGRLGYSFGGLMAYVTGGVAFVDIEHVQISGRFFRSTGSASKTESTWTVGGGLELDLGGQWSAKGEYLYVDLGRRKYVTGFNSYDAENNGLHTLRLGVNYRFNMPGLN